MAKTKKLVLIDGKALFHRAYHAIPHLTNRDGLPTNATYGFCAMVLKAINDLKPDYVVLAWDKAKTSLAQRIKLYPDYKVKRLKMPEDFYAQIPSVLEFAEAIGMPVIELDDYEADDIIGTIVRSHPELATVVVTNDRDMFQLLDGNLQIYMQRRGMTETEMFDEVKVKERYGLSPSQIVDYKALAGDASDNIPGVPGVGEKTATDLLQKYGDLDGIYLHAGEIPGKLGERIRDNRASAELSYKLATIMTDAPVNLKLESARWGNYDRQALYQLFRKLDFRQLIDRLPQELSIKPDLSIDGSKAVAGHLKTAKYSGVQTKADLAALVSQLSACEVFAFDTETDSLDTITANLVGMSFSFKEGEAFYVPVGHANESKVDEQLPLNEVIAALKPVLEDPKIGKVGHNIKFDYEVMAKYEVVPNPITFDTMVAAFIINPLARGQSMTELAYAELGIEMIPIEQLIGPKGKNQQSFAQTNIAEATQYAAEDADITFRLYQKLLPQIVEGGFEKLANQLEFPLISVLADMELAGVELDVEFLRELDGQLQKQVAALESQIWKLAGEEFNVNSPAQLGKILFDKLGLKVDGVRRGKSGSLSTAARELEKMRGLHPVVDLLFEYRELVKLVNTYTSALPDQVGGDGRVHTNYSQTIAQTGRLSSISPNLQNIPIRTPVGRQIRKAFVAPKGRVLVSADYSQIELRIAAAMSKDEQMIKAFSEGVDIHQQTAAELYGVPIDSVSKEQRYNAKTVNFGVLYGMSAHGLAVSTGMTREEAAGFIKRYYELKPKLAEYIEQIKRDAKENEYVTTLFGRKRPCGEINSNNHIISSAAERMAVNVPLQGTAADIMKLAMIKLQERIMEHNPSTKKTGGAMMLLQIHDELIVECDEQDGERIAALMKEVMENVYDLGVKIEVDTSIGRSWGEMK